MNRANILCEIGGLLLGLAIGLLLNHPSEDPTSGKISRKANDPRSPAKQRSLQGIAKSSAAAKPLQSRPEVLELGLIDPSEDQQVAISRNEFVSLARSRVSRINSRRSAIPILAIPPDPCI